MKKVEHLIKKVYPGSIAEELEIEPGDVLLSINDQSIEDVFDYRYMIKDEYIEVLIRKPDGEEWVLEIDKDYDDDLGIEFENQLMSDYKSCSNKCIFCFIDQMPPNMRETLYFKDDDSRLSFLQGNYITLTNMKEKDVDRIIKMQLAPINISVQTTNPELRCAMLRNPRAGETINTMRRFAESGITMNCQIVCCPGLNDGEELMRSMRDLEAMYPGVHSVSIVPVGLTKFREGLYPLTPFTKEHAAETLDMITEFGDRCLEKHGTRIFFCGDEFYILAGREFPPDEFFEEHTQLENGVGMLRMLETEFRSALRLSDPPDGVPFTIATGVSAAPYFQKLVDIAQEKYDTLNGKVYPIVNDFFGHSINVTGLITGQDLIRQLKGKDLGERLLISQNMLRRQEMDFLDDITLEEAVRELGVPIYPIEQDGFALWDAMAGELPEVKLPERGEDTDYYRYNQN